jgi:dTDP-4-dehydrorhamnose 3,5-epimerase
MQFFVISINHLLFFITNESVMKFQTTKISGVAVIDLEPLADERGFFARSWCAHEFAAQGLTTTIAQTSLAYTAQVGTVRGLHYQASPHAEEKLVRCVRGAAYVVVADLRRESPTHREWIGVELSAENRRMLYVPRHCAQGYQTLVNDTELLYQMSEFYVPESARGVAYDDPAFGIVWPLPVSLISPKDQSWKLYAA